MALTAVGETSRLTTTLAVGIEVLSLPLGQWSVFEGTVDAGVIIIVCTAVRTIEKIGGHIVNIALLDLKSITFLGELFLVE